MLFSTPIVVLPVLKTTWLLLSICLQSMSLERNKKDLLSKLIVLLKALPMASSKLFKNLQAISYNSLILYFLFNFFIIELKLLGKSNLKYKSIKINAILLEN